MKHLKIFEYTSIHTLSNIEPIIIDDHLEIKEDDKGIYFLFILGTRTDVVALLTGISKISGTKYENNTKLREIPIKNIKIQNGTKTTLIKKLLREMGYNHNEIRNRYMALSNQISLEPLIDNSTTIGDLLDNYKLFKERFFELEKDNYETWETEHELEQTNKVDPEKVKEQEYFHILKDIPIDIVRKYLKYKKL